MLAMAKVIGLGMVEITLSSSAYSYELSQVHFAHQLNADHDSVIERKHAEVFINMLDGFRVNFW